MALKFQQGSEPSSGKNPSARGTAAPKKPADAKGAEKAAADKPLANVSAGKGNWRAQIDHIAGHLKVGF